MNDLISRQAAIDYFVTNVGFHDEDGYPIEDECELREIWTGYFDGIPSAQPEIIRCKDCKYNATSKKCLNPNSFFLVPADDDFCRFAERREDEH